VLDLRNFCFGVEGRVWGRYSEVPDWGPEQSPSKGPGDEVPEAGAF